MHQILCLPYKVKTQYLSNITCNTPYSAESEPKVTPDIPTAMQLHKINIVNSYIYFLTIILRNKPKQARTKPDIKRDYLTHVRSIRLLLQLSIMYFLRKIYGITLNLKIKTIFWAIYSPFLQFKIILTSSKYYTCNVKSRSNIYLTLPEICLIVRKASPD